MEQATLRYAEELQQKKNHFFWPSLWKKAYFWLLIYYKGEVNHSGLQVTNYRPIFSQKIKLDKVGLGLAFLFLSSCGQPSEKIVDGQSNDTLTYYDNGNLKTYKKITSDSVFDINFYGRLENEVVDSMYRYRPFQDTLLAYERYIYNKKASGKELDIARIETDSGHYYQFTLTKPQGEWISLYIKEINGHWKGDTLIRGPMMTIEPRQIYLKDTGASRILGYVIDWGYFSRTDTIGSIGHIVNRFIEFEAIGR